MKSYKRKSSSWPKRDVVFLPITPFAQNQGLVLAIGREKERGESVIYLRIGKRGLTSEIGGFIAENRSLIEETAAWLGLSGNPIHRGRKPFISRRLIAIFAKLNFSPQEALNVIDSFKPSEIQVNVDEKAMRQYLRRERLKTSKT